jgi:hypothetical protein
MLHETGRCRYAVCHPLVPFATHQLNLTPTPIKPICGTNHAVVHSKGSFYGLSTGFVIDDNDDSTCATLTSMISDKHRVDTLNRISHTIHTLCWRRLFLCRSHSLHAIRKMHQTSPSTHSSHANQPPTTKANIWVCTRKLMI